MKDYKGSADHAKALAEFVVSVNEVMNRPDIEDSRRLEVIGQLLSGPSGIKVAAQVGQSRND